MKLNEFLGTDHPDDKIGLGTGIVQQMLDRVDDLDTSALLFAYRGLAQKCLPPIATERACAREWEDHPMFGILVDKDKWAISFQEASALCDQVFDVLLKRAG